MGAMAELLVRLGLSNRGFIAGLEGAKQSVGSFKERMNSMQVTLRAVRQMMIGTFAFTLLERFSRAVKDMREQKEKGNLLISDAELENLERAAGVFDDIKQKTTLIFGKFTAYAIRGVERIGAALATGSFEKADEVLAQQDEEAKQAKKEQEDAKRIAELDESIARKKEEQRWAALSSEEKVNELAHEYVRTQDRLVALRQLRRRNLVVEKELELKLLEITEKKLEAERQFDKERQKTDADQLARTREQNRALARRQELQRQEQARQAREEKKEADRRAKQREKEQDWLRNNLPKLEELRAGWNKEGKITLGTSIEATGGSLGRAMSYVPELNRLDRVAQAAEEIVRILEDYRAQFGGDE